MQKPVKPAPSALELEARFQAFVDRAAEGIARDFAALLNRAYELGVQITPSEVDPEGGYELTWLRGNRWHVTGVEWFAGMKRWAVVDGD